MSKIIGIYKIISPNNRVYIGQSIDVKLRISHYKSFNCKGQVRLYNSFKKHGVDNHKFEIIEECDIDKLNERERYWQDHYDVIGKAGLNCKLQKTDLKKGRHSEETKIKIGLGNKGKIRTEENKDKISKSRKGKMTGESHFLYGKKMNNEWRKKLSMAKSNGKHHLSGKKLTKEWIAKIFKNRNPMIGFDNVRSKTVLNTETGIYYGSCSEAAYTINIPRNTLLNYLNGNRKNKTNFIQA